MATYVGRYPRIGRAPGLCGCALDAKGGKALLQALPILNLPERVLMTQLGLTAEVGGKCELMVGTGLEASR